MTACLEPATRNGRPTPYLSNITTAPAFYTPSQNIFPRHKKTRSVAGIDRIV